MQVLIFCTFLDLYYFMGHEGRLRLGSENKNKFLFCTSLDLHYFCI